MIKFKSKKIIIIGMIIFILLIGSLIFVLLFKNFSRNKDINNDDQVVEKVVEEVKNDIYNYNLSDSASLYEEELFNDLKSLLSKEEVNDEEYAIALAKMFVADLFTLNSKKSSSDVTSSQYVYTEYKDKYKVLVMNKLYSSIELNLDGKRNQKLPIVKSVEVVSVEKESFLYNDSVIDANAFKVRLDIGYEVDMGYPVKYEVIIVKNGEVLEVVKSYKI